MKSLSAQDFELLTFDCYGTLVDWESALTEYLQPVLLSHDVHVFDGTILELFADFEPQEQDAGGTYRKVLQRVMTRYGQRLGFTANEQEIEGFIECIPRAKPFDDTLSALKKLKEHFKLGIVSNTDTDLIATTLEALDVSFDSVQTAEELGSYKPHALGQAIEALNLPKDRILHVAQSPYHDIRPASELGLHTVHIERDYRDGSAVQMIDVQPNWHFANLASFVDAIQI